MGARNSYFRPFWSNSAHVRRLVQRKMLDKPVDAPIKFSRSRLREYVSSRIRTPAGLMLESPPDHGSGSAHHGKS